MGPDIQIWPEKERGKQKRGGRWWRGGGSGGGDEARWSTYHPIHLNLKIQAKNVRDLTIYTTQRLPTKLFLASTVLVHRSHD